MKKYTRSKKYRRVRRKTLKGGYFWRRSTKKSFNKAMNAIVEAKMHIPEYCSKIKNFKDTCADCDKDILESDENNCTELGKPKSVTNNLFETMNIGHEGLDAYEREIENQKNNQKKLATKTAKHLLELNRIRTNPFTCGLFCENKEENDRLQKIKKTYVNFLNDY